MSFTIIPAPFKYEDGVRGIGFTDTPYRQNATW